MLVAAVSCMGFAFTSFAAQSAEPPVPAEQLQARSSNGLQAVAAHPHTSSAPVSQTSAPAPQPGLQSPEPLLIDLAGALQRARNYHQEFLAAGTASALAREDRIQAKAALLPTLNAFNQFIYTQGNGTPSGVFVANDGVHVYGEQAVAHAELFPFARRAE